MSVCTFALWAACFILTYTFHCTEHGTGRSRDILALWHHHLPRRGGIFVWRRLPGTKGKSLEEIETRTYPITSCIMEKNPSYLIQSTVNTSEDCVHGEEGTSCSPTYEIGKEEKNPIFLEKRVYQGSSGSVYPYPVVEKISDGKKDKALPCALHRGTNISR